LVPAVFDYVFTGKNKAAAEKAVPVKQLDALRAEFLYWYPADFYNSADELVYNHLTFLLFHHAALFPEAQWPRRIAVNGMVNVEGQKMSKSKGNFITLHDAIARFGADLSRLGLLTAAEGLAQPNWSEAHARSLQGWLLALEEWSALKPAKSNPADAWRRSRLAKHIAAAAEAYAQSRYRSALQSCLFDLSNDVKWYLRRGPPGPALAEALDAAIAMLYPVTPHFSSELAEQRKLALRWPAAGRSDPTAELAESEIRQTVEDVRSVLKLVGSEPKRITLFAASAWKYAVYHEILSATKAGKKLAIGEFMKRSEVRQHGSHAAKFIERLQRMAATLGDALQPAEEFAALTAAAPFFEKEFGCKVEVVRAEDAQSEKALRAEPGRPGIEVR
ncbi:MAG TPA: class I tRNA ligase family protein, partial [archaeon]|nr:class I tRNA ligase family protein [archaeon]